MLFLDTIRRLRRQTRDINELKNLSDRQLQDIGLARSEITYRVRANNFQK